MNHGLTLGGFCFHGNPTAGYQIRIQFLCQLNKDMYIFVPVIYALLSRALLV